MATLSEAQLRQATADREYLRACRDAGIEPDAPQYFAPGATSEAGLLDAHALREGGLPDFPAEIGGEEDDVDEKPDFMIPPATKSAFDGLLDILLPSREVAHLTDQLVIGRRVLVLAWMLGRGPMAGQSLAAIGRKIGVERATLSNMARNIERATGYHARGQKTTRMHQIYSDSRKKVVARKLAEKQALRMPEDGFSE